MSDHSPPAPLLQTPLHGWHVRHGGRMVGFGGWDMPVQYSSIIAEHQAVRGAAGIFDVSHMGRLQFEGPSAVGWMESMLTRRSSDMQAGMVRYTLIADDEGRILDDALVVRGEDDTGRPAVSLVVNASNRPRVVEWLRSRLPGSGVSLEDRTDRTAMMAVQGPLARGIVRGLCGAVGDADGIGRLGVYRSMRVRIADRDAVVSRTGYTGEDGVELVVAAADAEPLWEEIVAAGGGQGLLPCGLGARDTLRLEAGMPLYGHELREDTDPFAAGLGLAVDLDGREFPGAARFARLAASPSGPLRVGLVLEGRRPAREGCQVVAEDGRTIGTVTSGTFSPTLGRPIAMAYVEREHSAAGVRLQVRVRDSIEPAVVAPLPFHSRRKIAAS